MLNIKHDGSMSTETSPGKPFLEILLRHSPSPVSTSCPKVHLPLTPGRRATSSILPGMNLHSLTRTNPPTFPGNLGASPVPSNTFSNLGLFIQKCALTNPVWALAFQNSVPHCNLSSTRSEGTMPPILPLLFYGATANSG